MADLNKKEPHVNKKVRSTSVKLFNNKQLERLKKELGIVDKSIDNKKDRIIIPEAAGQQYIDPEAKVETILKQNFVEDKSNT